MQAQSTKATEYIPCMFIISNTSMCVRMSNDPNEVVAALIKVSKWDSLTQLKVRTHTGH